MGGIKLGFSIEKILTYEECQQVIAEKYGWSNWQRITIDADYSKRIKELADLWAEQEVKRFKKQYQRDLGLKPPFGLMNFPINPHPDEGSVIRGHFNDLGKVDSDGDILDPKGLTLPALTPEQISDFREKWNEEMSKIQPYSIGFDFAREGTDISVEAIYSKDEEGKLRLESFDTANNRRNFLKHGVVLIGGSSMRAGKTEMINKITSQLRGRNIDTIIVDDIDDDSFEPTKSQIDKAMELFDECCKRPSARDISIINSKIAVSKLFPNQTKKRYNKNKQFVPKILNKGRR